MLDAYYTQTLSGGSTRDQLLTLDRGELQTLVALCDRALAMPRRLGSDATSDELASDKKTGKRLAHCFRQSLKAWGGQEAANGVLEDQIRRRAATLRWRDLADARRQYLMSRFAPYATLAIDEEQRAWGEHILTLLRNELGWIEYAMR